MSVNRLLKGAQCPALEPVAPCVGFAANPRYDILIPDYSNLVRFCDNHMDKNHTSNVPGIAAKLAVWCPYAHVQFSLARLSMNFNSSRSAVTMCACCEDRSSAESTLRIVPACSLTLSSK